MPIVIALLSAQITIKTDEKNETFNELHRRDRGAEDTVMCVYVFLSVSFRTSVSHKNRENFTPQLPFFPQFCFTLSSSSSSFFGGG